ncbi:ABC transporter ATP-binding protein, partial [Candidatus Riflebacteria bacterium]
SFMIQLESITKIYNPGINEVIALNKVSFLIGEGEMLAVIGTSGSGKSTLLNILGCMDKPSAGKYFLEESDVSGLNKDQLARIRNRKIGFVFQNYNLLPKLNALQNVILPLLYRDRVTDIEGKGMEILKKVGLAERAMHKPTELSGGEKQRVAIGRALITGPSLILADEPTGNLDSKTGDSILDLFFQLNREGQTLIVVTHDLEIAARCKRQIHFKDGCIIKDTGSSFSVC